ncbi:hypothetical protein TrST_g6848 [Triparma strigata]|uniref:FAD/NAD(P)-binding domain-containing protein n=1 Tax=Triparma strigata TaxID=1606541 RepID=A0A9W6ZN80_9STRA|nr:hypothetical protein TrST_g6848 [Triparma strigata]
MRLLLNALLTTMATSRVGRVGIIGGGVGGCSAAKTISNALGSAVEVTVYEIGRGPGGRAATRRTREFPTLHVNHGAPTAQIVTEEGRKAIEAAGGEEVKGGHGTLNSSTGEFQEEEEGGWLFVGEGGVMGNLAASLIEGTGANVKTKYNSMVRGLERAANGDDGSWILRNGAGEILGEADWLVVAGSGVAHPRWTATFGNEPPLVEAAKALGDSQLDSSLKAIASQTASPVIAVFFVLSGSEAQRWLDLPFKVAKIEGNEVLGKVMIQRTGEEGYEVAVVLHSSRAFAETNKGVYGSTSSAKRVGGAKSDKGKEDELNAMMLEALAEIPQIPEVPMTCKYGPVLHRWGNAFVVGEGLSRENSMCRDAKVAFCGDYVETDAPLSSIECALLAGKQTGEAIVKEIKGGA